MGNINDHEVRGRAALLRDRFPEGSSSRRFLNQVVHAPEGGALEHRNEVQRLENTVLNTDRRDTGHLDAAVTSGLVLGGLIGLAAMAAETARDSESRSQRRG